MEHQPEEVREAVLEEAVLTPSPSPDHMSRGTRARPALIGRTRALASSRALLVILGVTVFLGWSLWLSFPFFAHGEQSYVALHDTGDMTLPEKLWLQQREPEAPLGLFDVRGEAGSDRLANGFNRDQDSILFLFLPGWLAYGLFMWLQRFVAGYFLFRLLRDAYHTDALVAAGLGLAYALFSQAAFGAGSWQGFALWDGLALPALPLMIWLMLLTDRLRLVWACLAAAAAGLCYAYASHFFLTIFTLPVIVVVALFGVPHRRRLPWAPLLCMGGMWIVGEGATMWAAAANAPFSHRADWRPAQVETGIWSNRLPFVSRLARDNVPALGAACLAPVLAAVRRSWRVLLLAALTGITFTMYLLSNPLRSALADHVPFLAGFRLDRAYVVLPFLLALTAGAGVALLPRRRAPWRTEPLRRRLAALAPAAIGVAVIAAVAVQAVGVQHDIAAEWRAGIRYASFYQRADVGALRMERDSRRPFRVVSVYAGPLYREDRALWRPGFAWAYGLESADGYSVLYSERYQAFWSATYVTKVGRMGGLKDYFERYGSHVYLYASNNNLRRPEGLVFAMRWRLPLLSLVGVRYVISPVRLRDPDLVALSLDGSGRLTRQALQAQAQDGLASPADPQAMGRPLYIYENTSVLPRVFVVEQARRFGTRPELVSALHEADVDELATVAFLVEEEAGGVKLADRPLRTSEATGVTAPVASPVPAAAASLRRYTADEVVVRAQAPAGGMLIFTANYSAAWRAWVDGREADVTPVDLAFCGVQLDAGAHTVRLRYLPPYRFWPSP